MTDDVDPDVREELAAHLAARIEENISRGQSPEQARRAAERRFGSVGAIAVETTRVRRRMGPSRWSLRADVRQVWRNARRAPLATLAGFLVAAVGLTTTFASVRIADTLAVHPPAGLAHPFELFSTLDSFDGDHASLMSYPSFQALAHAAPDVRPFAWDQREFQVASEGLAAQAWPGALASGSYFPALGTRAAQGRLLDPLDDATNQAAVVVSARMAQALTSDHAPVLGRALTINGHRFEIVGVAERGFQGVEVGHPVDLWLPLAAEPALSQPRVFPDGHRVQGFLTTPDIGWLRGGVRMPRPQSADAVQSRLTSALRAAAGDLSRSPKRRILLGERIWQSPFSSERDRIAAILSPMIWAVGLTILLTSTCLSSLFVGLYSDRESEFGIRRALGAGGAGLIRMAAFEVIVIVTVAAGAAGLVTPVLLAATGGLQLVAGVLVSDVVTSAVDVRSVEVLFTLAVVLIGLTMPAPLALVARMTRQTSLRSHRIAGAGNAFRRVLMAVQVGAGCALLTGAALLTQSIMALRGQDLGYDATRVAFAAFDPAGAGLLEADRVTLAARLPTLDAPAGASLAFADTIPLGDNPMLFVVGEASAVTRQFPLPVSRVSDRYFDVLDIRLVAGRAFDSRDRGQAVVVVSEPLAAAYWPGRSAIGQALRIGGQTGVRHEVIGVVAGVRDVSLKLGPGQRVYLPFDSTAESLVLLARAPDATPVGLVPVMARAIRDLDARLVPTRTGALIGVAWRTIEQRVLIRFATSVIGAGSLLMVAIGVWGLAHSSLRRRWREFGVRKALGAPRGHIARLAMQDARFVALTGGALGLLGSWQMGLVLKAWLFGVQPHSLPAVFTGAVLVCGAAFAGAIWPARAAGRIDPASLLRQE